MKPNIEDYISLQDYFDDMKKYKKSGWNWTLAVAVGVIAAFGILGMMK